jgi:predicted nucleic acid-binding protein
LTRYLVDTNVISQSGPARAAPSELVAWMHANADNLFLSTVTAAEIQEGIAKAHREGATRKAAALTVWFETVLHLYGERFVSLDVATARAAGLLSDQARAVGHAPGFADIVIAATARTHNLTILSRNLRHFAPLGVPVLDPFQTLPPP